MAESRAGIVEGAIGTDAVLIDAFVNGAVAQWAPVIYVAAGTGEDLPRVGTTTTAGNVNVCGVKVSPTRTLVAGDVAQICVHGRTKMKQNTAVAAFTDAVETSTVAGSGQRGVPQALVGAPTKAETQGFADDIAAHFARALTATVAAGDINIVDVNVASYRGGLT